MPKMMKEMITTSSQLTNTSNVFVFVLPVCDNLTDFVGHSRGLDLALDARPLRNLTEFDHLLRSSPSLSGNITCLEHAPHLTNGIFFKAIVLAVISIFSFVANVATIYSITKNRRKHHNWSAIYTLILHLAVADLLVTVFCIGGEALWSYTVAWIWGNVACKIFKFLQVFSLYLSTFVLVLIGIDRFVAVRYPMKGLNTAHRCIRLIILAWILSFVLAAPQIVIFHVAQGPFIEEFTQCVTHGFYTEVWQEQLYVSFSLFFMFLLPLAILITTYVSTVITISRSERMFKSELANHQNLHRMNGDVNRRRLMHRAKTKSLRISVVIVAAFVLWWTPYYTMMIIFMFLNPDKRLSEELQSAIFFFGMSNSLVNPLIYGAFHLWPRRGRQKSQRDGSTMQRRNTPTNNISSSLRGESREIRIPFISQCSTNSNGHVREDQI